MQRERLIEERIDERFWAKVHIDSSACWEWTAGRVTDGYGCFWVDGRNIRANRMSWQMFYGEIPPGIFVLHRCDNPACVRPDHLFLGTNADNMRDCAQKGRIANGERQGLARLTHDQVKKIRELLAAGQGLTSLAREFRVTPQQIYNIKHKKSWGWLQ